MSTLLGYAHRIAWQPTLLVLVELLALAITWRWLWARRTRMPAILQFVLFATPLSWAVYHATLGVTGQMVFLAAHTEANLRLNHEVVKPLLAALPHRLSNVTVLGRAETKTFVVSDYENIFHVKLGAGERFAADLVRLLDQRMALTRLPETMEQQ